MRTFPRKKLTLGLGIGLEIGMVLSCANAWPASSLEIYGFAQLDYIQDYRRIDPVWADTLRPSTIPTNAGQFGSNGQAILNVRQSRLGINGNKDHLTTKLEVDFFGVGPSAGQTAIQLRHAYGQWGQWLGGQTFSLFMDHDFFPDVIDYWGPCGMVLLFNPQIRWTPINGDFSFAVAIEMPHGNVRSSKKLPDLTAQVRRNSSWGYLRLSGILRRVGFETLGTPTNEPSEGQVGGGLNLSSGLILSEPNKLILAGVYGYGIASYLNDGGTDLVPGGAPSFLNSSVIPIFGATVYDNHVWNNQFSSSFGYSRTQVRNSAFQAASSFHRGDYASVNLLYRPAKNLLTGVELLWGLHEDSSGNVGTDVRSQVSFRYSFSSQE